MAGEGEKRLAPREFWFWVACFVIQLQPLEILISGYDPSFPSTADSARHTGIYGRFALALYTAWRLIKHWDRGAKFVAVAWPLLAFFAYTALVGLVMTMGLTAPRYVLLIIFPNLVTPFVAAALLRPAQMFRAWATALAVLCILSLFTALLLPSIGVVAKSEMAGIGTPGNWRGVFMTKNVLGHIAGVTLALLAIFRQKAVPNKWVMRGGIFSSAICLILSGSSTGYVLAAVLPLFYISILAPAGWYRFLAITITVTVTTFALAFKDGIVDFALGLLGKSPDISGRAAIWDLGARLIPEGGLFGKGIDYTSSKEFMQYLNSAFKVPYLHNETLDLIINLGILGAALFLLMIIAPTVSAWAIRPRGRLENTRNGFSLLMAGWVVSGLTEVTTGSLLALCYVPLCGFYAIQRYYGTPSFYGAAFQNRFRRRAAKAQSMKPAGPGTHQ